MDTRTLSRRLIRSRWVGLVVGIIVLIAWLLFLRSQLETLRAYPWNIAPLVFALGVLWGAVYFTGLAVCWALLLRHMSTGSIVGLGPAVRVWLGSMMTRYIPGNVWHVLSRVALAKRLQASTTHVLTSATLEQVLTLLGALVLFGLTLPFGMFCQLIRSGSSCWFRVGCLRSIHVLWAQLCNGPRYG